MAYWERRRQETNAAVVVVWVCYHRAPDEQGHVIALRTVGTLLDGIRYADRLNDRLLSETCRAFATVQTYRW